MKRPAPPVYDRPEDSNGPAAADERSLARGLAYRLIASGYRYPQAEVLSVVDEQSRAVGETLALLGDSADGQLPRHLAELGRVAQSSSPAELERRYVSLFGHVVRGTCPLYEAEYGESDERLQQPHELSDLSAFYNAFGLKLGGGVRERVDFLPVECEFMAFLCVKQAYAEEHDDAALAEIAVDAQGKFLRDHLGRWAPACARRIIDRAGDPFYGPLARFTLAYISDECRRLEVSPGKEHLKLRLPLKEEDACLSCPMAEGNKEEKSGTSFAAEE
jgi:DMSO reductase family type II enzyme chaperone